MFWGLGVLGLQESGFRVLKEFGEFRVVEIRLFWF